MCINCSCKFYIFLETDLFLVLSIRIGCIDFMFLCVGGFPQLFVILFIGIGCIDFVFLCVGGFPQLFRSIAETCRKICVCGWFLILCKLCASVSVYVWYSHIARQEEYSVDQIYVYFGRTGQLAEEKKIFPTKWRVTFSRLWKLRWRHVMWWMCSDV